MDLDRIEHHDVIIVGARVAGAATAMLLARQGLDVLLLDRERPGLDTLSTHALMRGAVIQLGRWGLLDAVVERGTPPIDQVVFHYGDDVDTVDLRGRAGSLYAPRRNVLDPLLVEAARVAGATVRHGIEVERVLHDPSSGRVTGVVARRRTAGRSGGRPILARHVIGADGRGSRIARAVGACEQYRGSASGACIYRHVVGLPNTGYEWVYRPGLGAGMIPTNDGATCVWVGAPTERFLRDRHVGIEALFDQLLVEAAPALAADLRGLPRGRPWGYPGNPSLVREPWGAGWALVGDAGAYRDPITAHGITDALRDAELLARAIAGIHLDARSEHEALGAYHATRDRFSLPIVATTDRIASHDWTLTSLREHLLELSDLMKAESRYLQTVAPPIAVAA